MPTEEAAVGECLADVAQSSDRIRRRNALKALEKSIIPGLCGPSAIVLLRGATISASDGDGTPPSLLKVLLSVIADDDTSEICREKAIVVLRACLHRACGSGEGDGNGALLSSENNRKECLEAFYAALCPVLYGRLAPKSTIGDDGGGLLGRAPPSARGPAEPSEEIRLVLVETALDTLTYMNAGDVAIDMQIMNGEEAASNQSDDIDSVGRSQLVCCSSMLCRALASTGLADPYPDLKRASCSILIRVAALFPEVVCEQAVPLLRPITGGAEAYRTVLGSRGGIEATAAASDTSSLPVAKSSSGCMVRHRHAKTRCLALGATASILMCRNEDFGDDAKKGDVVQGGSFPTSGSILRDHVLPCWEDFPPFDRSAAVRLALIKSVGEVAVGLAKESTLFHRSTEHNFGNKAANLSARMLVLLLMGMSDEAESIRNAASAALATLATTVLSGIDKPGTHGHACVESSHSTMIASLVSDNSGAILSVLLPTISGNLSLERKVRGVQALAVLIRLVNVSVDKTDGKAQCSLPATAGSDDPAEYPLKPRRVEIISALCFFFGEEEDFARNAAISCGRALGACGLSASSVLEILLPSLGGSIGEETQAEVKKADDRSFLISSPQQHAAALTLLGCLVEGILIDAAGDTSEPDEIWLSSYLEDITGSISSPRVLEVVSQDQCSADALVGLCRALVKCADMWWFTDNQDKAVNCSKNMWESRIVVDVLSCCFQLLGCSFDLSDQALLDSIPGCDGHVEKNDLLQFHFRDVLKRIVSESTITFKKEEIPAPMVAWSADDHRLHAFEALLRNSGGLAVGENFDLVAPVLECLLAADDAATIGASSDSGDGTQVDYTVKLSAMALVESIVSDPMFPKDLLHPFTAKLLDTVIIPNLVWRAGGMASSLRKVSAAALFSLLRCGGATTETLFKPAPRLLPVLKTSLSDDDASTRQLIISSFAIIFELLPGALGEDAVHQLYPDLVKCLDDSNDNVRFAACRALRFFFRAAAPRHFKGTAIDYMVEQLIIHMDDPDREFQMAVLDVLTVALVIDTRIVTKKAKEAATSHRSGELCGTLLRRAEERLAADAVMGKSIV